MVAERKERIDIDISGLDLVRGTDKSGRMPKRIRLCFNQFIDLTFDGLRGLEGNVFEEGEVSGTSRIWKFRDIQMKLLYNEVHNEAGDKKMLSVFFEGKGDGHVMDEMLERVGKQKEIVGMVGRMLEVGRKTEIIGIDGTRVIDKKRKTGSRRLMKGEVFTDDSILTWEAHEELVKTVFGESTRFREAWYLKGKDWLDIATGWDVYDIFIRVVSTVVKHKRPGTCSGAGGYKIGDTMVYVEKHNVENRFFLVITNNKKETEELFGIFCAKARKRKRIMESTGVIMQPSEIVNGALTREFLKMLKTGNGRTALPSHISVNNKKSRIKH